DGRRQLTYKHNRTRSCRALPTPPVCDEDTRALERPPAGVSHSECHWQRYVSRCARAALHRLPSYLSAHRGVLSPRASTVGGVRRLPSPPSQNQRLGRRTHGESGAALDLPTSGRAVRGERERLSTSGERAAVRVPVADPVAFVASLREIRQQHAPTGE